LYEPSITEQKFDPVVTNFILFFWPKSGRCQILQLIEPSVAKAAFWKKYAGGIHFPVSAELKAVSPNVLALLLCLTKKILG